MYGTAKDVQPGSMLAVLHPLRQPERVRDPAQTTRLF
jgi:hypothetical protein